MTDEEQQAGFAPTWRPEKGDPPTIRGRLVSAKMGPDFGFGASPIIVLATEDGERTVFVRGQMFREELAERHPRVGDELEITYKGKRRPKREGGIPYHVYQVRGGQEPEFDWDQFLPEEQRQSSGAVPIAPAPTPSQTPPVLTAQELHERQVREASEARAAAAEENFGDTVPF